MRFTALATPANDRLSRARAEAVRLLDAYEHALGCTIVVHDPGAVLFWQGIDRLVPDGRRQHHHPLCDFQRARPHWGQACNEHCLLAANRRARRGEAFLHRCWKGGAELVVPVLEEGHHVLTIFCGVFRGHTPSDEAARKSERLRAIRRNLPRLQPEKMARHIRLVRMLGENLIRLARGEDAEPRTRSDKIRDFLRRHGTEDIGLPELARELGLSTHHCSRIVSRELGRPFQELLREERLQRAALLLGNNDQTVGEIAHRVGFKSEYHFSRKFRQRFGEPPGVWRQRLHSRA